MDLRRRDFLKGLGVGLGLAATRCSPWAAKASPARPNIILCMADDQGWGDVAYNGHPVLHTPNLDAMAAAGLRFDRFYAAAPVCSPTRGSVLTGRHPNRFGCFKWGYTLRPQETTLAEALRAAGYATGHFGKWHLGSVRRGSPVNPGANGFDEWLSAPNFFDLDPILSREGVAVEAHGDGSMVTAEAAIAFMRGHARAGRPFLAVVWFASPHPPHQALAADREPYRGESEERQHFYGEITALDRAVGRLRRELRSLGIEGHTLLWYCSDNGGLRRLGATGGRGHKFLLYEGGLRVPAILEWPAGVPVPRATRVPCNTSDMLPTLLEVAAVQPGEPRPLDGISLVPLLAGAMAARPEPMGFWDYPAPGISTPGQRQMRQLLKAQRAGRERTDPATLQLGADRITRRYPDDTFPGHAAWLDWPWKLHRLEGRPGEVELELYDLAADPGEERDLAGRAGERAMAMRGGLEAWLRSVVHSLNGGDYLPRVRGYGAAGPPLTERACGT